MRRDAIGFRAFTPMRPNGAVTDLKENQHWQGRTLLSRDYSPDILACRDIRLRVLVHEF